MTLASGPASAPASVTAPKAHRLVRVSATSPGANDELVRRYRLARLRLEPREAPAAERFDHLKCQHD